ncbi:ribosome assembly cofactor RimP [Oceanihabitans sediminis]|uniref:Ribosome maturation factor RimP n=1 Tax=Oceanihabitans sediminis TaxID=1812012 RepID=A0A368P5F5_9FLAO|nr:ribosome assembly cofactor RimP [Oceanihabitans sediminis]MDX1278007.1 ribosome assembly cofactor RimP [Oceanihabitans sediminis]MDX1772716.1 ribosome assembly cofactor RimP [Oceanihabitans sediminis]RBP34387.1 ribosome maturation factor RimP [Oceanihabitans sediminis]RCU58062.1 ribosome assembly cofactor RimP [Oceanihabitans sediminis]
MFKNTVQELLAQGLEEKPDLFLIDLSIAPDNAIKIIIDGDNGVTVEDCMFISRAIEHNLDREEQDFSLEVASAGATSPLTHKRQYIKNIGRSLEVKTQTETIEGALTEATEDEITLQWKSREPKPIGKGKVTVQKQANIAYENIVEAKVMIKF